MLASEQLHLKNCNFCLEISYLAVEPESWLMRYQSRHRGVSKSTQSVWFIDQYKHSDVRKFSPLP